MESATRTISQKQKVLNLLKSKEEVSNVELNEICFQYNARMWELKREGYDIRRHFIRPGLHSYYLNKGQQRLL